jgi:hypothetical protein
MATHFDKEILKGSLKTNTKIRGGMGGNQWMQVFELPFNIGNGIIFAWLCKK